ncbi:MAG: aminotransferase class V-fold PLP-dependent enzyme [Chloroflexota bacterium]
MSQRSVYMDNAATTPVDPRVVAAMSPYLHEAYGNPSSVHQVGQRARAALDAARETAARVLGATPTEIVFTSCGTESDNLALRGAAWALRERGRHLITTSIEHHAVSHTCEQLQRHFGIEVTYLPVDRYGLVAPEAVARAIRPDTTLISVMYANNEVGTIEPIAEIGAIARAHGVVMHTDAVQAGGYLDLNVDRLNVDLLALSGHKLHAPKGVGLLYVRRGTPLLPTQTGGGQERGLRAGTENLPYIVGLAAALELAYANPSHMERVRSLRDRLIAGVLAQVPDAHLTGHPTQRMPNSASFAFEGVDGEAILTQLDLLGVAASTGSACSSGESEPSPVLTAMGMDGRLARGSLRLSLGRATTAADVDYVLAILPPILERLRQLSPLYVAQH